MFIFNKDAKFKQNKIPENFLSVGRTLTDQQNNPFFYSTSNNKARFLFLLYDPKTTVSLFYCFFLCCNIND